MPFPCPSCRYEIHLTALDGGRPICGGCRRMWHVSANFLEGVFQARSGGGSIHSICWADAPVDGVGQLGAALLYFLIASLFWLSLPFAALFLYAAAHDVRAGESPAMSLGAVFVCVAGFAVGWWLMRRFHYLSRGVVATWPTLIVGERGLYDVVSFANVLHVPWQSVLKTSYTSGLFEETLTIDFATADGVRALSVSMGGSAIAKPLWDTALYIEEERAKPPADPETAIRDLDADRQIQEM